MTDVVIDRKQWYRGQGDTNSCLLIPRGKADEGKMCCLGSVCLAAGLTKADIRGKRTPESLGPDAQVRVLTLFEAFEHCPGNYMSEVTGEMIKVNDDESIQDAEREERIIRLGKNVGFNISFTG